MPNLFYFTGENAFALREEKRQWQGQFGKKHGMENLLSLDGAHLTFRGLLDEVSVAPFIAQKRLVVVSGTPKFSKEEVEGLLAHIHPDCVVVFCDARPDKRLGGVKALLKSASVKEFSPLRGKTLLEWAREYAALHGSSLDGAAAQSVVDRVGDDQEMLASEIAKLSVLKGKKGIAREDVDQVAVASGEREVWQLTSLLSQRKQAEALKYTRNLLSHGEDPFSVWHVLLWTLRNLVSVALAVREGSRDPGGIASALGVPFPTVRTLLPFAQSVDMDRLTSFVDWASQADTDLKTGGYKATGDAPDELLALIDQFVMKMVDV